MLTVDPAQRLKDTLGLGRGDGAAARAARARGGARRRAAAHLDAYLLDVKRTFDELIVALAAPEQARIILENRLYQNLSGSLAGTAEYMAVEQRLPARRRGRLRPRSSSTRRRRATPSTSSTRLAGSSRCSTRAPSPS